MAVLEKEFRMRKRKLDLRRTILTTLSGVSGLAVVLIAPKLLRVLPHDFGQPTTRIKRSLTRLEEQGFVTFIKGPKGMVARITPKGDAEITRLSQANTKPKTWDGRWRVVIYDIGEDRKNVRARLRENLISFGFIRLQNSVWIYPYDCENLVQLIKAELKVGKDVLYMIVDSIENDKYIRARFKLSPS